MSLPPDTVFTATTPEQARLLTDLGYYRLLGALMKEECSASELARMVSLSVQQVHHRLTRLLTADLIEVVGERRRSGRPVKLYRAPHEYRVPFHLTDAASIGELMRELQEPVLRTHFQSLGHLLNRYSDGLLHLTFSKNKGLTASLGQVSPDVQEKDVALSLFFQRRVSLTVAQETERRLQELRSWFNEQPEEGEEEERYTLGLLFTPEGKE